MSNRLSKENSPYLLQHASNPVDWYPWGDEAFQAARERELPIFLSIGYAACHWCHVMEHESFEDSETAQILNDHFISIKVDREERPDVDAIYMQAVTAITGQGGWPLSVFLTPEGEPFYGGTYFPPQRRYNLPSFRDVLTFIKQRWEEDRQSLLQSGRQLTAHISHTLELQSVGAAILPETLTNAAEQLWKEYDWEHGGWGSAPKFPSASTIEFLLSKHFRDGDSLALDMAKDALLKMANGGLFDQLIGGFHRYSVDRMWLVPHFEKMLYDNALLGTVYLHAWQSTGDPRFEQIARQTLEWMLSEMQSPEGGFYASLDADSEGDEGKFYVWTQDEIAESLKDDLARRLFSQAYGVSQTGNFEGANVLHRAQSIQQLAEDFDLLEAEASALLTNAIEVLRSTRDKRQRPLTDDKIIAGWNGLVLTFLAEAGRLLDRAHYLPEAQKLASFLTSEMLSGKRLNRIWRDQRAHQPAMLEDYAAVINGLIDLYQVDFDPNWIEAAQSLMTTMLDLFDDPQGGFYDSPADLTDLIARPKSVQDAPIPSGNSLAIRALLRFNSLSPTPEYEEKAMQALAAFQSTAEQHPSVFSTWLLNLDWAIGPVIQLALVGEVSTPPFLQLAKVSDESFQPRLIRAGGNPSQTPVVSLLQDRQPLDDQPTAFLCLEFTCRLPTTVPEELRRQFVGFLD
jgi:uncharacterized protein YyaL (SSP411 family)